MSVVPALWQRIFRDGARLRIVGMAGCPSCGVITTSRGYMDGLPGAAENTHVRRRGLFMEELLAELERRSVASRAEEVGKKKGTGGES